MWGQGEGWECLTCPMDDTTGAKGVVEQVQGALGFSGWWEVGWGGI